MWQNLLQLPQLIPGRVNCRFERSLFKFPDPLGIHRAAVSLLIHASDPGRLDFAVERCR